MKTAKEIVALIASAHPPMLDEQELEALEQVINLPGHPIPFHSMDTPLVARLTRMVKALAAHVEAPIQPEPPKAKPQSHKATGAALITEDFKGTLEPKESSDAVAAQQAYNGLDMLYALLIKVREKTPRRFQSREMEDARIAIREAQAFIRDELAGKI